MRLRLAGSVAGLVLFAGSVTAQDTASARTDTVLRPAPGRWTTVARRGTRIVFGMDSTADRWSRHHDPASGAMRAIAPLAFWAPIAVVAAEPLVWAEETQEEHALNARYAQSASLGLVLGFAVSQTTKHLVRRPRPCSGACSRFVDSDRSFFSEHTMAVFAIASATSFQAQREEAPNATRLAAISFTTAGLFGLGRVYQHHHWLSDVIVGAAVGTAAGFVAAHLTPPD